MSEPITDRPRVGIDATHVPSPDAFDLIRRHCAEIEGAYEASLTAMERIMELQAERLRGLSAELEKLNATLARVEKS